MDREAFIAALRKKYITGRNLDFAACLARFDEFEAGCVNALEILFGLPPSTKVPRSENDHDFVFIFFRTLYQIGVRPFPDNKNIATIVSKFGGRFSVKAQSRQGMTSKKIAKTRGAE